jgi:hypothetical protein
MSRDVGEPEMSTSNWVVRRQHQKKARRGREMVEEDSRPAANRRDPAKIGLWFFAFPIGFMTGSSISGRIGAKRSIEFMTILSGVVGVVNGALLVGWLYFGGVSMAALYIPGMFVSLAQGLSMPYAQARAMAVDTELAGSASGAGGVLAVLLAGRAAAAHRPSRTVRGCRWQRCTLPQ